MTIYRPLKKAIRKNRHKEQRIRILYSNTKYYTQKYFQKQ